MVQTGRFCFRLRLASLGLHQHCRFCSVIKEGSFWCPGPGEKQLSICFSQKIPAFLDHKKQECANCGVGRESGREETKQKGREIIHLPCPPSKKITSNFLQLGCINPQFTCFSLNPKFFRVELHLEMNFEKVIKVSRDFIRGSQSNLQCLCESRK